MWNQINGSVSDCYVQQVSNKESAWPLKEMINWNLAWKVRMIVVS